MCEKEKKSFAVHHERGGYLHVFAADEVDAIEQYYLAVESMVGHSWKCCECYPPEERNVFDRSLVIRPVRVEKLINHIPYKG